MNPLRLFAHNVDQSSSKTFTFALGASCSGVIKILFIVKSQAACIDACMHACTDVWSGQQQQQQLAVYLIEKG